MNKGTIFQENKTIFRVVSTEYHNPGRGAASVRAQIQNLETGSIQHRVFGADESIDNLFVETQQVQFLYGTDDILHFMNLETYDQYEVPVKLFGDDVLYLKNEMELQLLMHDTDRVLDYNLPTTIVYSVAEAEIAVAGNTAGAVTKRVKTETGLSVQVPAFISVGESIKVDTRDGSYVGRA